MGTCRTWSPTAELILDLLSIHYETLGHYLTPCFLRLQNGKRNHYICFLLLLQQIATNLPLATIQT